MRKAAIRLRRIDKGIYRCSYHVQSSQHWAKVGTQFRIGDERRMIPEFKDIDFAVRDLFNIPSTYEIKSVEFPTRKAEKFEFLKEMCNKAGVFHSSDSLDSVLFNYRVKDVNNSDDK